MRHVSTLRAVLAIVTTGLLAGCAGNGTSASNAYASMGTGSTIAFESIDGPPPQVFERMVAMLDDESSTRNLSIVSREGPAAYRIRSYLSAHVYRGRTKIAWVWDVYDRDGQRALRLSGEEAAGKNGRDGARDAWASADNALLRRIAQAGLTGLNGIASGGTPSDPPALPRSAPSPRGNGPAIASADDRETIAALSFKDD